ncbi:MAG: tetratricopeptide repeat protein [Spirochaetes bacterium]|nr:MAG: tetratricopeptide repeat protein [Spirochaetota bacterium]
MNRSATAALVFALSIFTAPALTAKEMTILVHPFENTGDQAYSWISAGMTSSVVSDLGKIQDVTVISEPDRKKAVDEIQLGLTGLVDEQKAVKVGRVLGANLIFSGNYLVAGTQVRVNAVLIDVEKGSVQKSVKVDGTLGGIFDLQDRIVFALMAETEKVKIADVKPVRFTDDEKKKIETAEKPSFSAYELYAKGLQVRGSNPRTALDYFKKALEQQPDYLAALGEAGYTAGSVLNLFAEGLGYLERADALFVKRAGTNTREYANLMARTGLVYKEMDKLDKALECYAKSRDIRDTLGLQNTSGYAALMTNTGSAYWKKGQYDKALELYGISEKIKDSLGEQKTSGYAALLTNIGLVYAGKKQPDTAMEYYIRAREIRDALALQKTDSYAVLLSAIGSVYFHKGAYDQARENYVRAQEIRDALGLADTTDYAGLLFNIGLTGEKQGNKELAGQYFRKAYDTYVKTGYTGANRDRALKNAERLGH